MPFAACLVPKTLQHRGQVFVRGLERCGYRVTERAKPDPVPGDLLVIWNRYRAHQDASNYERSGASVVVAENGYVGRDLLGRQMLAMALSHHNGAGRWRVGSDNRWADLAIDLLPWRTTGEHLLVLPQRGIGAPGVAMPKNWVADVVARLRGVTDRPIRIRLHPGDDRPSLDKDFRDCWAVVTWGSGAAIKAIVAGVPVFHEFVSWIGAAAARAGIDNIEDPFLGDRMPMLRRLAWAQWSAAEIETGEPFRWLLM